MKRLDRKNINTKEYLNGIYTGDWEAGYRDAYNRLDVVISNLGKFNKHLDVGCANGYFTRTYTKKYPDTKGWGVDISDSAIEQSINLGGGTFQVSDVYSLPFVDTFDLVHMGEVLEHLEYPDRAIKEMERVANTIIITTPNNGGGNDKEHLWAWEPKEIVSLFSHRVLLVDEHYFNGNLLYILASK